MNFKRISLHPKLAAGLDLFISFVWLLLLAKIDSWQKLVAWLVARFVLWGLLVLISFYPSFLKKIGHWLTLCFFGTGILLWLIFIDWQLAWYLVGLASVVFPAMSFWLIPSAQNALTFVSKSHRRWRLIMTALAIGGIWSAEGAAFTLQLFSSFPWWLSLVGALVAGGVAVWWWKEYDLPVNKHFWFVSLVLALAFFELDLAVRLWPLGYFASGLFLTWWWYLLWLIFRFYLSAEGLNWKKQIPFLVTNVALMIVYLTLVVRWR